MKDTVKMEPLVTQILEDHAETRSDDYLLFLKVTQRTNPSLVGKSFLDVMNGHYRYGLPNWESVTRARRKIQSKRPDLCDDRTILRRADREKEFKEYARV